jgi:hypothetical protein
MNPVLWFFRTSNQGLTPVLWFWEPSTKGSHISYPCRYQLSKHENYPMLVEISVGWVSPYPPRLQVFNFRIVILKN